MFVAFDARVERRRALVSTIDTITYDDKRLGEVKVEGSEGYELRPDGSLAGYFICMQGHAPVSVVRVSANSWAYATNASRFELQQLGFKKAIRGEHTIIRVVTVDEGVQTHRVTRLSTVRFMDRGRRRWTQYVSLDGFHRRENHPDLATKYGIRPT